MRTPPGLRVASERPWMIMPPWAVHSAKSPWHQTPGKRSKYAERYLRCSGSFQNITGVEGNGLVQTSSPFCSRTGLPSSDINRHAQSRSLNFAAPDRSGRIAEHKAGHDVSTAGNGGEVHVRFNLRIDVIKAVCGERRAGRGD